MLPSSDDLGPLPDEQRQSCVTLRFVYGAKQCFGNGHDVGFVRRFALSKVPGFSCTPSKGLLQPMQSQNTVRGSNSRRYGAM